MHTVNVGYGYTSVWSTTNVGVLVGRLGLNLDYGLRPGTYNIHAADTFGSVFSGDEVHIGWDPAYGYNYQSKWIIAHELGHAVEERLIGEYLGSSDYSDNPSETTCRCDSYISGADGQHCLQSREVVQAAIGEGWAQFFAASLFNNPAGSTAWFGYYKKSLSFTNPNVNDPILPPRGVSVIPTSEYRWMETRNCVGTDKGVEVDWMGFWYYVHNKTSNKYSFDEIEDVYEQMCNGTCVLDTADKPTWSKLRTAAETLYSGSKESHFVDNGVEYGVNH